MREIYSFEILSVETYTLDVAAPLLQPHQRSQIDRNIASAIVVDVILSLRGNKKSITVSESQLQAETASPQIGAVISSSTGVGFNDQVVIVFSESMNQMTLSGGSNAENIALLAAGAQQPFNTTSWWVTGHGDVERTETA